MTPRKAPKSDGFRVVGIGASAGGLEATNEFLAGLPLDTGVAFVVVHHLAETSHSFLPEILARSTELPVVTVTDQLLVEPNHIYVMPGTADVEIKGEHLLLVPRSSAPTHLPIDQFFTKLAESRGELAVGVLLSGTGADGSKGLQAIRKHGGLAFVQDVATAKYQDMPRHALQAGDVDLVGAPADLAAAIVRGRTRDQDEVAQEPDEQPETGKKGAAGKRPGGRSATTASAPDSSAVGELDREEQLARVFLLLRQKTGVDFSRYKRGTLLRRMQRRMQMRHTDDLQQYVEQLQKEPDEVRGLFGDLLIGVTEFFRDAPTFDFLRRDLFPRLIAAKGEGEPLRLWVAGAATGEEAYSLGITLLEAMGRKNTGLRVQIFASDVSEANLEKAREGIYPPDIASTMPADRLARFFDVVERGYRVKKSVRQLCVFARHNLISDPPFSRLDMVSCRNLMIYFDSVLQERVGKIFNYSLNLNGYLLLGRSESLSQHVPGFDVAEKTHHLYRKTAAAAELPLLRPTFGAEGHLAEIPASGVGGRLAVPLDSFDPRREAERVLAVAYAPASVLVDERFEILSFQGKTGPYLEHAEGKASFDLLPMARAGVGMRLRRGLEEARESMTTLTVGDVEVEQGGRTLNLDLEIRPFQGSDLHKYFVVIFRERQGHPAKERAASAGEAVADASEDESLREELEFCRRRLESVTQEKDVGLEEMRAAYEEIQSSNEELQSTNEELETAKEELESVNEELISVNDQLDRQNVELSRAHDLVANLLANAHIPIVVVDRQLRIDRFAGAEGIFDFQEQDVGRRLTDLVLKIKVPDLEKKLKVVTESLGNVQSEVQDQAGRWYSMVIRPYRTLDDHLGGAILSFTDIDELKRKSDELAGSEKRFRALIGASSQAIYHMNADWTEMRQLRSGGFLAGTEGADENWLEHYIPPEERPRVLAAIAEAIRTKSVFQLEHRVLLADGQVGLTSSHAMPVLDDDGEIVEWFGAASDITGTKGGESS